MIEKIIIEKIMKTMNMNINSKDGMRQMNNWMHYLDRHSKISKLIFVIILIHPKQSKICLFSSKRLMSMFRVILNMLKHLCYSKYQDMYLKYLNALVFIKNLISPTYLLQLKRLLLHL